MTKIFNRRYSCEFYLMAAVIILLTVTCIFFLIFIRGFYNTGDFPGQHTLCVYALRGLNPYAYLGATSAPAEGLSVIPANFTTTPWGLLLGNIFYFGFLDMITARIAFTVLCMIMIAITGYLVYAKALQFSEGQDKELAVLALLMALGSEFFWGGVHHGNGGTVIGFFLILSWILCDDHPVLTGFLMGFSMIKPQTAFPICFAFMLQKKFVPVIIAAAIDISAWFAVSLMVHTDMLVLLHEFLTKGVINATNILGIFAIFEWGNTLTIILSMCFGLMFVAVCHYKKSFIDPYNFILCFSYMASTFWCYTAAYECYVLVLPAIVCLYIMKKCGSLYERIFWFFASVYCGYGSILRSRDALFKYVFMYIFLPAKSWYIPYTVHEVGIIILAIIIYLQLNKQD